MKSSIPVVWLLVPLATASCGGKVIFDGGSGGATVGSVTSTGTTKPTSATVGSTGTSKPTSATGTASVTVGSTATTSATVGSTTTASTTVGTTSSTTVGSTSSATVGSTGSGVDCQSLTNEMQDAVNAAAMCDPNSPMPQCSLGSVMNDRCGCPTVVLNGTQPAKVMAAKNAYTAWTNAGCGPQACGTVCKPATSTLCIAIGGTSWCVSETP